MSTISEILILLLKQDSAFEPLCDVKDEGRHIFVELEITDLDLNRLSINIIDGFMVEIVGSKKRKAGKEAVYLRAERVFGAFRKRLELPCPIDRVKDVNYLNGILKITLEKR